MPVSVSSIQRLPGQAHPARTHETPSEQDPRIVQGALAAFIDIEAEFRQAVGIKELRFILANAIRRIVAYDQALVLQMGGHRGRAKILCVSDVPAIDRDSSRIVELEDWIAKTVAGHNVTAGDHCSAGPWTCAGPEPDKQALFILLGEKGQNSIEMLLLLRPHNWQPSDFAFLKALVGAFNHASIAVSIPGSQRPTNSLRRRIGERSKALIWSSVALGILALALVPIPMFAYAPAEIVGADARLVTAPIDGAISDVFIQPGQAVQAGQQLLTISDTKLRNELEIAKRSRELAEAKHARLVQQATANRKDLTELATAKAELAVAEAQLSLTQDMLSRAQVLADADGVVIFGAKSDWIGKPVQIGERIMEIVNPARIELKIDVSVADVMSAESGATVKLYLDGEPFTPLDAVVHRTSYRAQMTPDRILAFRTFAAFGKEQPMLRIGLRGTARIAGPKVSLGFYLFRRPIAALRQRLGI